MVTNTNHDSLVVALKTCLGCGSPHWLLEHDPKRGLICVRRVGERQLYPLFDASDMTEGNVSRLFQVIADRRADISEHETYELGASCRDTNGLKIMCRNVDSLLQQRWDALEVPRRPMRNTRAWNDIRLALVFGAAYVDNYALSYYQRAYVFRLVELIKVLRVPVVLSAGPNRGLYRGVLVDARLFRLDGPLGTSGRTLRERLVNRVNLEWYHKLLQWQHQYK